MPIDWNDVQGIVVRGNNYPRSWHLFYLFPDETAGKAFLRWIGPQVATAQPFPNGERPDSLTYLGLSYRGLRAVGLESLLKKINSEFVLGGEAETANPFPEEFINAPEQGSLGDTNPADQPSTWWNGQFDTNRIHGSLHIYCQTEAIAEQRLDDVRAKLKALGIVELNPNGEDNSPLAGNTLADRRVHFGYVDGIAQPDVDWENETPAAAMVDRRHFLLGYDGPIASAPRFARTGDFFRNSTYMAFRWMSQDVPAFEQFLTDSAPLLNTHFHRRLTCGSCWPRNWSVVGAVVCPSLIHRSMKIPRCNLAIPSCTKGGTPTASNVRFQPTCGLRTLEINSSRRSSPKCLACSAAG